MFNLLLYIKKPLIKSKTDEIDTLNKLADTLFLNSNNLNNKNEEIIDEEKNNVNDV
jgi:hydroxyethylthiazole kinase-like sugar kinase family protein